MAHMVPSILVLALHELGRLETSYQHIQFVIKFYSVSLSFIDEMSGKLMWTYDYAFAYTFGQAHASSKAESQSGTCHVCLVL